MTDEQIDELKADRQALFDTNVSLAKAKMAADLEIRRLRTLIAYCRPRMRYRAYQTQIDKHLADLSTLDPNPEMTGKIIQSA